MQEPHHTQQHLMLNDVRVKDLSRAPFPIDPEETPLDRCDLIWGFLPKILIIFH